MIKAKIVRRVAWAAGATVTCVIILLLAIGVAIDTGHLRAPLIRFIASRAGRPVAISGPLEVRVLSFHPYVIANGISLGNPPWMPAGPTAEVGKLTVVFALPWFGHSFGVETLEMQSASLHLVRLATGHANWQWSAPGTRSGRPMAIIRSLSAIAMQVELDDARRHLKFRGTVSAHEAEATAALRGLRMEGAGELNGRSATFHVDGDPLVTASHATPYHFTFAANSSGSDLGGSGFLLKPFDFSLFDTEFNASGANLKDLYFLTGVSLVNTGAYRLSGKIVRRGRRSIFSDLTVTSGQSDLRGTISIETTNGRSDFDADLNSQFLRLADLGARAAGSAPDAGPTMMLSNASFNPGAIRRGDGIVKFHARHVEIGRQTLQSVAAKLTIDHGILVLGPLTGQILDGMLTARIRIDALTDDPLADLDLSIKDLQLGELARKNNAAPAMEGPLRIRVLAKGHGTSIHQAAASANGTVTAVLPHGLIRASLAELAGIDLRGVRLLAAKSLQETAVHCGVASFTARDGTLSAQSLVVDSDLVLITGDGTIHLDTETLDLALRGHPKGLRLARLRSPLLIRGTLAHPSAGIQAGGAVAQVAESMALGVLLTPLASILAFVDPGLNKNADCAGLIAAADGVAGENRIPLKPR